MKNEAVNLLPNCILKICRLMIFKVFPETGALTAYTSTCIPSPSTTSPITQAG